MVKDFEVASSSAPISEPVGDGASFLRRSFHTHTEADMQNDFTESQVFRFHGRKKEKTRARRKEKEQLLMEKMNWITTSSTTTRVLLV